jgi:hypothetical protein
MTQLRQKVAHPSNISPATTQAADVSTISKVSMSAWLTWLAFLNGAE